MGRGAGDRLNISFYVFRRIYAFGFTFLSWCGLRVVERADAAVEKVFAFLADLQFNGDRGA